MKTRFFLPLVLFLIVPLFGVTQKIITVDFQLVTDTVKNLQGGNKYFDNTASLMHDEGIDILRTHDYHHLLDYSDYSAFWNYNGQGNYTINNRGCKSGLPRKFYQLLFVA